MKEIIVVVGMLIGAFLVYADNGELRGELKVLEYRIQEAEGIIDRMSDQLYEECEGIDQ